MNYWNYRVVRSRSELENEYYYSIREVYYNDKNEIVGISSESQKPIGNSLEELQVNIERMLKACEKDVLIEDEIHYGDWD